jgi:hypothetical protein
LQWVARKIPRIANAIRDESADCLVYRLEGDVPATHGDMSNHRSLNAHPEISPIEDKPEYIHEEDIKPRDQEVELLKSRFDDLPILRVLWLFRKSAFYVFLVYTGYVCEGFEVCVQWGSGLIIALCLRERHSQQR